MDQWLKAAGSEVDSRGGAKISRVKSGLNFGSPDFAREIFPSRISTPGSLLVKHHEG